METSGWRSHHFSGHRRYGGGKGKSGPRKERASRALATPGGLQDEAAYDRGSSGQPGGPAQYTREIDATDRAQGTRR